ncbi:monovalent cation/H+ antiporter complex subunit F [Magnetovibrio blakemorei]|jgi:multicomponent Na+:H+ antiporter subunit F|nr:monovalent cation/H+ antiporter complex subunit F [Magnetovibrio blakemorei]
MTITMYGVAALAVLISMALSMIRAFVGPTVFDRILAVNVSGTLTVVLISVYGFLDGRPDFLDIGLLYALINFIGTIAVTKYVKFQDLGHPMEGPDEGDV